MLLSSNLLKGQYTAPSQESRRMINADDLLEKRRKDEEARAEYLSREGFQAGLVAETVEVDEEVGEESESGNVIKAKPEPTPEELLSDAQSTAEALLESANREAEALREQTARELEAERESALEQAREQGYREGLQKAEQENARAKAELESRRAALEQEYQTAAEQMETQLVEILTDIYEHVFHVELSGDRDILIHLAGAAMRRAEGSKEFLVRVSGEDYAYVDMNKRQLQSVAAAAGGTLELVEDSTLSHNQCMIETQTGVLDCGLDTQLEELTRKLRLLSYGG